MAHCPICDSKRATLLYPSTLPASLARDAPGIEHFRCTSSEYGIHDDILRCDDCALIYQAPSLTGETLIESYEDVEDPVYLDEEAGRIATFSRHLRLLDRISAGRKGHLLEIGAYTGLFAHLASTDGWDVTGLEPSAWAVGLAEEHYGIRLTQGSLAEGLFEPQSFDAVVAWDVIEHVPTPAEFVRLCRGYLKPGGIIALSTMDAASPLARVLGPRWPWLMCMHRVYFTRDTMRRMLAAEGFNDIRFQAHVRYVSVRFLASRFRAAAGAARGSARRREGPPSRSVPDPTFRSGLDDIEAEVAREAVRDRAGRGGAARGGAVRGGARRTSGPLVPYVAGDLFDCWARKPPTGD